MKIYNQFFQPSCYFRVQNCGVRAVRTIIFLFLIMFLIPYRVWAESVSFGQLITVGSSETERRSFEFSITEPMQIKFLFRQPYLSHQTISLYDPDKLLKYQSNPSTMQTVYESFMLRIGIYTFKVDGDDDGFLLYLGPNPIEMENFSDAGFEDDNGDGLTAFVDVVDWRTSFPDITLTMRVLNNGIPHGDLGNDNFQDAVEQVDSLQYQSETRLSDRSTQRLVDIIFCVDDSGSMEGPQSAVRENIESFTQGLVDNGFDFRLGLVRYGEGTDLMSDSGGRPVPADPSFPPNGSPIPLMNENFNFTNQPSEFRNWFDSFEISGSVEPSFDAILFAGGYSFRPEAQKVVILITDESSNGDVFSKEEALYILRRNSIVLYAILGAADESHVEKLESQYRGPEGLVMLTGGKSFDIEDNYDTILNEIGNTIGAAYQVTYTSQFTSYDGKTREGTIQVQDGENVDDAPFEYTVPFQYVEPTTTETQVPTSTATPAPTSTPTPIPTSTETSTPFPTDTPTSIPTDTLTPVPTKTITPFPTDTRTAIPTDTPAPIATDTPTATPTRTPVYTLTPTHEMTFTATPTPIIAHLCTNDFSLSQLVTIPLHTKPKEMISDDFNNDGYNDLLTALPLTEELLIFIATGDLHQPFNEVRLSLDYQCEFVASGDINGDGFTDVCAVSYLDEKLTVLFSDKAGNFDKRVETTIPQYVISTDRQQPITCADTDGDGSEEIYVVYSEDFDEIYRLMLSRDGDALNANKLSIPSIQNHTIQMLSLEDMTGDGELELAVITSDDRMVHFFESDALLNFYSLATYSLEDTIFGNTMTAFQIEDADGNNLQDLLVLPFDGTARLYTSLQEPLAQQRVVDIDFSGVNEIGGILDDAVITDLDNDGNLDMIYVSRGKGIYGVVMLCVVCGERQGEFRSSVIFPMDRPTSAFANLRLEAIDLNRDGIDDLALVDDYTNELVLFQNTSNLSEFTPKPTATSTPRPALYEIDLSIEQDFTLLPAGQAQADIAFNFDGVTITTNPGEGILVISNTSIRVGDIVSVSLSYLTNSTNLSIAAIGFDGVIASNTVNYTNQTGISINNKNKQKIETSFLSHSGNIIPAFQVYNDGNTLTSVTITELQVRSVNALNAIEEINLEIDGGVPNLDGWVGDVLQSGAGGPIYSSENHSQLETGSIELKGQGGIANAALSMELVKGKQVYECYVKRSSKPVKSNATFVLMVTDGVANTIASFFPIESIPDDRWIKIMCSGTIHVTSGGFLVIQSAGSKVLVDDIAAYLLD